MKTPTNTPPAHTPTPAAGEAAHLDATDAVPHFRDTNAMNGGMNPDGYGVDIYDVGGCEPYAHVFASTGHGQSHLSAKDEAAARAAFIVTACNSYAANQATIAALVNALNWAATVLEEYHYAKDTEEKNWAAMDLQSAIDKARAALQLAKEGSK